MALKIAKDSGLSDVVGEGNEITTSHPIEGSTQTVQLWLFNDDETKRYESISISVEDTDLSTNETSWIELSLDGTSYQPSGSSLSVADINDTSGHTFYVRVTSDEVTDTMNKTDLRLNIEFTEFAV